MRLIDSYNKHRVDLVRSLTWATRKKSVDGVDHVWGSSPTYLPTRNVRMSPEFEACCQLQSQGRSEGHS